MAGADVIPDTGENPATPEMDESQNLKLTFSTSTQLRKKSLSRSRRSSEIISFARSKSQSAWSSVKIRLMRQRSMPEGWRNWSTWWPSDPTPPAAVDAPHVRWPNDAEESLFCESLMGLMHRCGRFEYLSGDGDVEKKRSEEKEESKEKDDRRRRLSSLKQIRANRSASRTL